MDQTSKSSRLSPEEILEITKVWEMLRGGRTMAVCLREKVSAKLAREPPYYLRRCLSCSNILGQYVFHKSGSRCWADPRNIINRGRERCWPRPE